MTVKPNSAFQFCAQFSSKMLRHVCTMSLHRYALAACGLAQNPTEGVAMAREAQISGKAGDVLTKWIEVSKKEKALEGPGQ